MNSISPASQIFCARLRFILLLFMSLAACRPRWEVAVGTDAPIPQLGTALFVEILDPSGARACADCARFISAASPENWPVTFTVETPPSGSALLLRARLFREDHTPTRSDGAPATAFLDGLAWLPELPASPITYVGLPLYTACFHQESNISALSTCLSTEGLQGPVPVLSAASSRPPLPRPGSYPPATAVPCSDEPPDGMACIPGGLLVIGNWDLTPEPSLEASAPVRLVQLSPFFIDRDELTVDKFLALRAQYPTLGEPVARYPDPKYPWLDCTYPSELGKPLNCISYDLAVDVCRARGRKFRLPTEAEWEYVAGNLALETEVPWQAEYDEDEVCEHAAVSRSRYFGELGATGSDLTECRHPVGAPARPAGPAPVGTSGDVTALDIHDMAGNLSEWTDGVFAPYTAPCWSQTQTPLVNPRCHPQPELLVGYAVRGGSWTSRRHLVRTTYRDVVKDKEPSPFLGLRCVKEY